jgi:penicillin amidase
LGLVPAAGWDGAHEWDGFIPAVELPRLYNPESGKIVLANHKVAGDDYPYFLGADFDPGWRAARIEEMLAEKDRHTIRDMEEMQLDNVDKLAQAFTPWFTLLRIDDPWEKVAIQALRKWNWRMDSDNPAGLIFSYLMNNLLELVYADKLGAARGSFLGASSTPLFPILGSRQRAETALLQIVNEHEESFWYADVAKRRSRTRDELLQEALTRSMKLIRRVYGDSMLRWAWGKAHQVRFAHPLSRARFVGGQFDRGPLPVGGDGMAPNLTAGPVGLPPGLVQTIPVYRQIYEVGTWDRAESVLAGGQAGHALSRLYDDQIMMWREGAYHVMPWSREAVEKVTEYRLILQPA